MYAVYSHQVRTGPAVAYINKQSSASDGYRKEEPWLLLRVGGRIDRFASLKDARTEAIKSWPGVSFRRI